MENKKSKLDKEIDRIKEEIFYLPIDSSIFKNKYSETWLRWTEGFMKGKEYRELERLGDVVMIYKNRKAYMNKELLKFCTDVLKTFIKEM